MAHAWHRKIKVTARDDGNGGVKFDDVNDLTFRNKFKGDYHLVTFYLDEKDDLDLQFDRDDPIWAGPAPNPYACPPSESKHNDFRPLFVSPSGKELTVVNLNTQEAEIGFALNFTNQKAAGKAEQLDPIADNKNGGGDPLPEVLVIGVVVACTAALLGGLALWLN